MRARYGRVRGDASGRRPQARGPGPGPGAGKRRGGILIQTECVRDRRLGPRPPSARVAGPASELPDGGGREAQGAAGRAKAAGAAEGEGGGGWLPCVGAGLRGPRTAVPSRG